jgi:hypothetical protein
VLPGGESDMTTTKFNQGLASGEKNDLPYMIGRSNALCNEIEKVVWKESPTGFGYKVCLLFLFFSFPINSFSFSKMYNKLLNPVMLQRESSCIGQFLTHMKNVYYFVCSLFLQEYLIIN